MSTISLTPVSGSSLTTDCMVSGATFQDGALVEHLGRCETRLPAAHGNSVSGRRETIVPGRAHAKQVLAAGDQVDAHRPYAPAPVIAFHLGDSLFTGSDVPQQPQDCLVVGHVRLRCNGCPGVVSEALDDPAVPRLECVDQDAHCDSVAAFRRQSPILGKDRKPLEPAQIVA